MPDDVISSPNYQDLGAQNLAVCMQCWAAVADKVKHALWHAALGRTEAQAFFHF